MTPKRPSAVSGLRRGVGQTEVVSSETADLPKPKNLVHVQDLPPAEEPKARVTLNLPAPTYRSIERWAMEAAGTLGVPRVGIQDALRAMIKVALVDDLVTTMVVDQLRRERGA